MALGRVYKYEDQRSLAFGSIGVAYSSIGTAAEHPIVTYELYNLTDVDLQFSLNGVTDNFPLPANGNKIVDVSSNQDGDKDSTMPLGTLFYVKRLGGAPTQGSVYISIAYRE